VVPVLQFSASVVEIYNERCRDLLAPANDNLQVFQDAGGVRVPGMAAVEVATEAEAMAAVARGLGARATGATAMNDASSRSHCLVVLGVERTWTDGRTQRSKLCLVVRRKEE
jgi:kinesin family protein 5